MCQTVRARTTAASSPHAAETNPDFRRMPMRMSSRMMGVEAARAERPIECIGSSGCGQGVIDGAKRVARSGLLHSKRVLELGFGEADQLRLDQDLHARAFVDGLPDALDQH